VALFIMGVNVVGLGVSTTVGGFMIDAFAAAGRDRPITDMMLVMTAASLLAVPAFYVAARRFSGGPGRPVALRAGRGGLIRRGGGWTAAARGAIQAP